MFVRMELTERRTHISSLVMMAMGLLGCFAALWAMWNTVEFGDSAGRVIGASACLFLLWMAYAGVQRNVNAEMWRQADSFASQLHWYLNDVVPVIDPRSRKTYLRIQLEPGALNNCQQVLRRYIPETHPDYAWLSQFAQEEDVCMRVPVRLSCIAPDIIGKQQPERLFDLLRIRPS